MNGRAWTDDEIETVRINYADWPTYLVAYVAGHSMSSTYQMARKLGLAKSAKYLASPMACRLRRGDNVGERFRFAKGHVPANKGLRRPGWSPGRMAQTQFKPGVRQGRAAAIYQPVGTLRMSRDGYLERKINEDLPFQARWRSVHLLLWEEHLGPLPPGHCICFKNGNKTDIRIDNLACISRAERMRRNTIHNYPEPIKQAMRLVGSIKRASRQRHEEQDRGPARPPVRRTGGSARQHGAIQRRAHARCG
jgi:hypothetical protein